MLTRKDVVVTVCDCGQYVRLTHRWEHYCSSCGERIPSGAVGPYTFDDCANNARGHGWGTWDLFRCNTCGQKNPPVEVSLDFDDFGAPDAAIEWGLAELDETVLVAKEKAREELRDTLEFAVANAIEHLPNHTPGGECYPDCTIQPEWSNYPGVYFDEERRAIIAWEWDPTSWNDDGYLDSTIEVERRI